jgi:hypothetical protein
LWYERYRHVTRGRFLESIRPHVRRSRRRRPSEPLLDDRLAARWLISP